MTGAQFTLVMVVDYPVMVPRSFPLVQFSRPLRFPSCSTLIRCSMSLLRSSSRFVLSRGRRSRSHSCSSNFPGKVVARPLCATTDAHGRRSSSTVANVLVIMRDSGNAPDSGHREFGGHSRDRCSTFNSGNDDGFLTDFASFFALFRLSRS